MCRLSMTRFYSYGNCLGRFAQYLCYKYHPRVESDEHDSSDEDVFSLKPQSVSPDWTIGP